MADSPKIYVRVQAIPFEEGDHIIFATLDREKSFNLDNGDDATLDDDSYVYMYEEDQFKESWNYNPETNGWRLVYMVK